MKKANKFGGNLLISSYILIVCVIMTGLACNRSQNDIQSILRDDKKEQTWVNKRFVEQSPLAQLVNIGNFCDTSCTFELSKPGVVQIYAVGELVYQLANVAPEYFFKSDDIELFFKIKNGKGLDSLAKMNFSWLDGANEQGNIATVKYKSTFAGAIKVDSVTSKYLADIRIPLSILQINHPANGTMIPFDVLIGDNDDEYKQKAKLALFSESDILNKSNAVLGSIVLQGTKPVLPIGKNMIRSAHFKLPVDTNLVRRWRDLPGFQITRLAMGTIKDKYDLSAIIKSCWDNEALSLHFEIQDHNRKRVDTKKLRSLQTFIDYAWIEGEKGNKIWEMHELDSSPAGGAVKNRKIDQQIRLKAGKYTLHYISDESHAFNNWDDAPPLTPFYGVVVYDVK